VYRSIGGHAYGTVYPGPVGSVLTPALRGLHDFGALPHASTLCGACREICPVRIDLPRMLLALRARDTEAGGSPAWIRHGIRLYAMLATRPPLFRAVTWVGRRLARLGADDGWLRRLPGPLHGWTAYRDLPAPAARTFTAAWRLAKQKTEN
jgi:L-lactate dehydrogenase complex protein LldF